MLIAGAGAGAAALPAEEEVSAQVRPEVASMAAAASKIPNDRLSIMCLLKKGYPNQRHGFDRFRPRQLWDEGKFHLPGVPTRFSRIMFDNHDVNSILVRY